VPDTELVGRLRAAGCVFAEQEAVLLATASPAQVERRLAGEPLEQVLGYADFCGIRVALDPGVFVPRQRSVLLVRTALALLTEGPVVDLCCGSGALGAALLSLRPGTQLHAADLSPEAVACARRNVPVVHQGDLFDALPRTLAGRVDLVLANVPYVPTEHVAHLPPEAREHEQLLSLDGGPDGLDVLRRVAAEAPDWLRPGGHLVSEVSAGQVPAALDVLGPGSWSVEDQVVIGRAG
jgi:release factor glutamine methyltransferase